MGDDRSRCWLACSSSVTVLPRWLMPSREGKATPRGIEGEISSRRASWRSVCGSFFIGVDESNGSMPELVSGMREGGSGREWLWPRRLLLAWMYGWTLSDGGSARVQIACWYCVGLCLTSSIISLRLFARPLIA